MSDIERELLLETVIACLVEQLGGEARIERAALENPPPLNEGDDSITGEWIYWTGRGWD